MPSKEFCSGCGKFKEIVLYRLGLERFCSNCSGKLDKAHKLEVQIIQLENDILRGSK